MIVCPCAPSASHLPASKPPVACCPLQTARSPVRSSTPYPADSKPRRSPRFSNNKRHPPASSCRMNKIADRDYLSAASTLFHLRRENRPRTAAHLRCLLAQSTKPTVIPF